MYFSNCVLRSVSWDLGIKRLYIQTCISNIVKVHIILVDGQNRRNRATMTLKIERTSEYNSDRSISNLFRTSLSLELLWTFSNSKLNSFELFATFHFKLLTAVSWKPIFWQWWTPCSTVVASLRFWRHLQKSRLTYLPLNIINVGQQTDERQRVDLVSLTIDRLTV